jgi:hypothetical protein
MVRKDFLVERTLGGEVALVPAMTYRIEPAILYLTERQAPGFLKDYSFQAGSLEQVYRVSGPAGAASVMCVGTKEMGQWKIQTLAVEFEGADVAEDKRVILLQSAGDSDRSGLAGSSLSSLSRPRERAAELHAAPLSVGMRAGSDGPVLKLRCGCACSVLGTRLRWAAQHNRCWAALLVVVVTS